MDSSKRLDLRLDFFPTDKVMRKSASQSKSLLQSLHSGGSSRFSALDSKRHSEFAQLKPIQNTSLSLGKLAGDANGQAQVVSPGLRKDLEEFCHSDSDSGPDSGDPAF